MADELCSVIDQSELELAGIASRWSIIEREATTATLVGARNRRLSRFQDMPALGEGWNNLMDRYYEEFSWK